MPRNVIMFEVDEWDNLVSSTYGRVYNFQQQNGCKNFRITEKEVTDVIEDTFSIYAGGDHVVLKVYQSSNDGKLRRYDFPMNAIVDYVNMEINKYGSD